MTTSNAQWPARAQLAGTTANVRRRAATIEQGGLASAPWGGGHHLVVVTGVLLSCLLVLAPVAGTISAALRDGATFSVPVPSPGPQPSPSSNP
ncbi:MAG: hypothetical protein ACOH17_09140 [Cellulomonas sp.]